MNLIFDVDDTLYDRSWPFKMAVHDLLPEKDIDLEVFYKKYMEIGETFFPLLQSKQITSDEAGYRRFKLSAPLFGYDVDEKLSRLFQKTYKSYQGHIVMDDTLKEYLKNTSHYLAILTNGDTSQQSRKIKVLGLDTFIDASKIFISTEIGIAKPDQKAFQYVLNSLNLKAEDSFYIGDNYEVDIMGAKNAGLHTIYFNRHHNETGTCAEYEVYTEKELIQLLQTLEG